MNLANNTADETEQEPLDVSEIDFDNIRDAASFLAERKAAREASANAETKTIDIEVPTGEEISVESDETPESPEPSEEEQEADTYEVKVNGVTQKVTLEELRNGYSRQSDYSQKTAELAREREKVQTEGERDRQQYLNAAAQALQIANSGIDPVLRDWFALGPDGQQKLANDDPAQYTVKRAATEHRMAQLQQYQRDVEAHTSTQRKEHAAREYESLVKQIPAWKDAKVLEKEITEVGNHLINTYGFEKRMIDETIDSRMWMIARKSYLYDKQQNAAKTLSAKKVTPTPSKTLTPRGGDAIPISANWKKDFEAAKKSGDYRKIASVLARKPKN